MPKETELTIWEREPSEEDATEKQKRYIKDLGFDDIEAIEKLGKKQASDLISQLIPPQKPTAPRERKKRVGKTERERQRAYLSHMGVSEADSIKASDISPLLAKYDRAIEPFHFLHLLRLFGDERDFAWPTVRADLRRKDASWFLASMIKHPELYRKQLVDYLREELRNFVRNQIVGASGILKSEYIADIIMDLSAETPDWWAGSISRRNATFFSRLQESHPECCDGHKPVRRQDKGQANNSGSGCCVVLAVLIASVVTLALAL
jgi:hypothetical protein